MFSYKNIRFPEPEYRDRETEKRHNYISFFIPLVLVVLLWVIKLTEITFDLKLGFLGVYPKHLQGLPGIFTAPFVHKDFGHLISNSVPLFILGFLLINSYRRVAWKVFLWVYLFTGGMVWLVGREAWHFGASGIVYGLAFFIFSSGIFRKDIKSIALSLLVAFAYGSIVWGVFPGQIGISWESHLMGAIAGVFCAWLYRKIDLPPIPVFDDVEVPDEEDLFEPFEYKLKTPPPPLRISYKYIPKTGEKEDTVGKEASNP